VLTLLQSANTTSPLQFLATTAIQEKLPPTAASQLNLITLWFGKHQPIQVINKRLYDKHCFGYELKGTSKAFTNSR
jgi:hypothetical protein